MENKLKVLLTTLILTLAVVLFVSFRPIKASADSLPISNQIVYVGDGFVDSTYFSLIDITYPFIDNDEYASTDIDYFFLRFEVNNIVANGILFRFLEFGPQNYYSQYSYSIIYNQAGDTPVNLFFSSIYYVPNITIDDNFFYNEDNYYDLVPLCELYVNYNDLINDGYSYFVDYVPFENTFTFNGVILVKVSSDYADYIGDYNRLPIPTFTELKLNSFGYTAEDLQTAIDKAYKDGQSSSNQASYDNGYTAGYNRGLTESSQDYGITDLLFSVFDVPIEVLSNTFSFTIFGTTFWSIIVSMLALLVVLWVVRLFIK